MAFVWSTSRPVVVARQEHDNVGAIRHVLCGASGLKSMRGARKKSRRSTLTHLHVHMQASQPPTSSPDDSKRNAVSSSSSLSSSLCSGFGLNPGENGINNAVRRKNGLMNVLAGTLGGLLLLVLSPLPKTLPARARLLPASELTTDRVETGVTTPVRASNQQTQTQTQTRMPPEQVLEKFQNIPVMMLTDASGHRYKLNQESTNAELGTANVVPLFMSPVEMLRFAETHKIALDKSAIHLIGFEDALKLAHPSRDSQKEKHVIVPSQHAVQQAKTHASWLGKRMETRLIIPLFSCDGLTLSRDGVRSSPVFLDTRDLLKAWKIARKQNRHLPQRPKIIVGDALSLRLMLLDNGTGMPFERIHIFPSEETLLWISAQNPQKAAARK